jgi:hypothetical protein
MLSKKFYNVAANSILIHYAIVKIWSDESSD